MNRAARHVTHAVYDESPKGRAREARRTAEREAGTIRQKRDALNALAHSVQHSCPSAKRVLVVSDIQFPFQDQAVMELVYDFAFRWKPDTLLVNGDLVDCYVLSQFLKDPQKAVEVRQLEKLEVKEFFKTLQGIPNKIWLGGNHEDRWRKVLWRSLQARGAEENALLQDVLDLGRIATPDDMVRGIYGTAQLGVTYWPYGDYVTLASNNLVVTHGFRFSQHSAYTARMHFERLGRSVIIGHTHRQGVYRATNLRGTHGAWETGCLCRTDPEYVQFPNWQQGFATVEVTGEHFHVNLIPVLPGPSLEV